MVRFILGLLVAGSHDLVLCILVQVTFIAIVAGVVSSRRNPTVRHSILLSSLVIMLACPIVTSVIHWSDFRFDVPVLAGDGRRDSAGVSNRSALDEPPRFQTATFEAPAGNAPNPHAIKSDSVPTTTTVAPTSTGVVANSANSVSTHESSLPKLTWRLVLTITWLLGVSVALIRICRGFAWVRSLVRSASSVTGSIDQPHLSSLLEGAFGSTTIPTILESRRLHVPIITGFIKPTIVLPSGLLRELSTEELSALVVHEFA
ncbi:M56 family metallopeptidase, partial [Planctomycetota bacterium]